MKERSGEIINIISKFGKSMFLVFSGVLTIHLSALLVDYFLIRKPLVINLEKDFVGSAFSYPMIPIIVAYFIFSLAILYLWNKMKKAVLAARESERRHEKQKILLGVLKDITGLLGQHITTHNSEIQRWLVDTKMKKKQPPKAVEDSSRKISEVLGALTEIAFLAGAGPSSPDDRTIHDIRDIEILLKKRISGMEDDTAASEIIRNIGKVH
ncbi:MAG TPA: hypothetical protein PK307_04005 [Spirochaetota bacterium]|nr:hypothetical protein [Spirochaetota bacterium]HOD14569.1 hypothetical protein [Spirochaetota bacterium]HPG52169.1 hypothetical protein [Spirochaetota bacterium]HPN12182.1 hypothetical protein [Spirochaetota bacterium]HQL81338.1 hypothetical protein [Spirochaetota bacterium]